MDGWKDGWMDGWMDGCGAKQARRIDVQIGICFDGLTDGFKRVMDKERHKIRKSRNRNTVTNGYTNLKLKTHKRSGTRLNNQTNRQTYIHSNPTSALG